MTAHRRWLRSQCNRLANGECRTGECLIAGGWPGHGPPNPDAATCDAYEAATKLDAYEQMLAGLHKALCLIDLRDEWTFAGRHEAREVIRRAIAKAEGRKANGRNNLQR